MNIYFVFSIMLVLNLRFVLDIPGIISNVLTFVSIVIGILGLVQNRNKHSKSKGTHSKKRKKPRHKHRRRKRRNSKKKSASS